MLRIEPAAAEACAFAVQGEGRVASIVDARSFRLADGSEVRLAGIEPVSSGADDTAALSAMLLGEDVTLRGEDDTPDRYGRQAAFVFLKSSGNLVQGLLLAQGAALVSPEVADKDCAGGACRRRGKGPNGQAGNLGQFLGHKKRGKSGRYFGRDRAIYGSRGQSSVRPASGGNDLSEFWTKLDTGLCRDYFKAHDTGVRAGGNQS